MTTTEKLGDIQWVDLTVPNADQVRDFYRDVVGWSPRPVDMGGYSDYEMLTRDGKSVAGVCHARGGNANLPPQWLIYVNVADLNASIARCEALGGKVVTRYSSDRCVIQDPAGAVLMICQA